MKKILFFIQNGWAFGSIHHGLTKELYHHGIYCNLLDWTVNYSSEEFKLLLDTYDYFVTLPEAVLTLNQNYNVPFERIIAIAHGQWDILLTKSQSNIDFYPLLKNFAVISQVLKSKCEEWNISVVPKIVELGLHFDHFYSKPSNELKIIGYAGASEVKNFFGQEIKRSKLILKILQNIQKLKIYRHNFFNHLCMPAYYKEVDCVLMSSIEEAGGLPMMEAAAAGRLPIGTPVGYFEHNAKNGGGILTPLDENDFVDFATEIILFYMDNPKQYVNKCLEVQEYAKNNYDWSVKIKDWVELFSY